MRLPSWMHKYGDIPPSSLLEILWKLVIFIISPGQWYQICNGIMIDLTPFFLRRDQGCLTKYMSDLAHSTTIHEIGIWIKSQKENTYHMLEKTTYWKRHITMSRFYLKWGIRIPAEELSQLFCKIHRKFKVNICQ